MLTSDFAPGQKIFQKTLDIFLKLCYTITTKRKGDKKMTIYTNDWGETATTQDEIIRKNIEHMNEENLVEELRYQGLTDDIIAWALKQDTFRSDFDGYIEEAEKRWAIGLGWWEEEEEEDPATYEFEPGRVYWNEMAANP